MNQILFDMTFQETKLKHDEWINALCLAPLLNILKVLTFKLLKKEKKKE